MRPEIGIIVGSLLFSFGVVYACWVQFRVWRLRQDIFMIRNQLWREMWRTGSVDDLEHRELREILNAVIRLAPWFSLWTIIRMVVEEERESVPAHSPYVHPIVRAASEKFVIRLTKYIVRETALGLSALVLGILVYKLVLEPTQQLKQQLWYFVSRAVASKTIQSASRLVPSV
jgi:hypothetical protein